MAITSYPGQKVIFFPTPQDPGHRADEAVPFTARVVYVHPTGEVNIAYADHIGEMHWATHVEVSQPDAPSPAGSRHVEFTAKTIAANKPAEPLPNVDIQPIGIPAIDFEHVITNVLKKLGIIK